MVSLRTYSSCKVLMISYLKCAWAWFCYTTHEMSSVPNNLLYSMNLSSFNTFISKCCPASCVCGCLNILSKKFSPSLFTRSSESTSPTTNPM